MTRNKTDYTPTEALKCLIEVSKNALYNDMKDGTISFKEEKWGKKTRRVIQGVELARVYGSQFKPQNTTETSQENEVKQVETLHEGVKTSTENNVLLRELDILREQLKSKTELLDEVKKSRDDLSQKLDVVQETLQSQTRLLEDHRTKELENPPEKPAEPPKRFLGIFSRKTA